MTFTIKSPKYGSFDVQIDDEDWNLVSQYKWYVTLSPTCTVPYAISPIKKPNGQRGYIRLHRLVMLASPSMKVDHISCDVLDNRKSNLRFASDTESSQNRRKFKNNKSGVKGVWFENFVKTKPWRASICVDKKQKNLGRYATIEEASEAYAKASKELHGSFGRVS